MTETAAQEKNCDGSSSQHAKSEEKKDSPQQVRTEEKDDDVLFSKQARAEENVLSPHKARAEDNYDVHSAQQARALLREYFLRAVQEFSDEPCNVVTYELSTIQTKFGGWNMNGSEIFVRNLNTPAGITLTSALLRTTDVIAIKFENPLKLL